ncbi:L-2-amino-thiazoline-4-carboxylic acid hydrolase domain-containing protein [Desulfonema limicola]|uniref:L-2-amino-thiazoline-4-carboxylic acid hydrolase domain-containing protein n=2 Tax=Desulfonema limicola TaxID=45656 RepID=A0A975B427_9BACT|nr:L-2-amino-thiazoline-4-carboxylic acid hydrolase domain-containing protein [Desulfonema limicola]
MYVATIPNRNSPPAILIRESYRQEGKSKTRTISNISKLPIHVIKLIERSLKGETFISTDDVLNQRKIEAEIASALIKGFEQEVGSEKAIEIASKTIRGLARDAGKRIAETNGSNDMKALAKVVKEMWSKDNALEIELLEETSDKLFFNVKQCCYAEMYINSGLSDFGYCLSCNRDAAFVNGFNPDIIMKRTKTIMEGAICCDFRFYIN